MGLFGGTKTATPAAVPEVVTPAAAQQVAPSAPPQQNKKDMARMSGGIAAGGTVLTTPMGVLASPQTSGTKTLLGS